MYADLLFAKSGWPDLAWPTVFVDVAKGCGVEAPKADVGCEGAPNAEVVCGGCPKAD